MREVLDPMRTAASARVSPTRVRVWRSSLPTSLALTLAAQPDVVARLLAQHVPDGQGRCRGCTRPGTGTPMGYWPCTLSVAAETAEILIRRPRSATTSTGHQ